MITSPEPSTSNSHVNFTFLNSQPSWHLAFICGIARQDNIYTHTWTLHWVYLHLRIHKNIPHVNRMYVLHLSIWKSARMGISLVVQNGTSCYLGQGNQQQGPPRLFGGCDPWELIDWCTALGALQSSSGRPDPTRKTDDDTWQSRHEERKKKQESNREREACIRKIAIITEICTGSSSPLFTNGLHCHHHAYLLEVTGNATIIGSLHSSIPITTHFPEFTLATLPGKVWT